MRRARIELGAIADLDNLARAAFAAGRGKRSRPEAMAFFADLEASLARLAEGILAGTRPIGRYRAFTVWDPKRRIIHAPCFEDRVLHHALFAHAGPVLERGMVDSSFACRVGKGPLAAVHRAQSALRRWPWYVKVDVQGYFDGIDHGRLLALLARRFKGAPLLALFERILGTYCTAPGKGLPIGTLASQYFANAYLDGLDRLILEQLGARDHARYMDDSVWWCDSRGHARESLECVRSFCAQECQVTIKPGARIDRSAHGLSFLGYRILPGTLRLSRRRRRRYTGRRLHWERVYARGELDAAGLQRAYAAVHAITVHADSKGWRRVSLAIHPQVEA